MTNQTKPRHDIHTHPEGISVGSLMRAEMANHNYEPITPATPHNVKPVIPDLDLTDGDRAELALTSLQYAQEELRDVLQLLGELPPSSENSEALAIALEAHTMSYTIAGYLNSIK